MSAHNTKRCSLLNIDNTSALTFGTCSRRCSLCSTRAAAFTAIHDSHNLDSLFTALCSLFKCKCNSCLSVSSALRSVRISSATAESAAEEGGEYVTQINITVEAEATAAVSALTCTVVRINACKSELVVSCFFLRIG